MKLDPQMMAMLLQQAGQYRDANQPQQAPNVALGNQTVPSAAPRRSLFIDPRTAVQPGGGMPGMSESPEMSMAMPGMSPQQGQQGQMDIASLLGQAQQYRQQNQGSKMGGGLFINPMNAGRANKQQGMVDALRRSAMGEY